MKNPSEAAKIVNSPAFPLCEVIPDKLLNVPEPLSRADGNHSLAR